MQKKWWFFTLLLVLSAGQVLAGQNLGTEGGGIHACLTPNLPANTWSLIAYDNAGQPCQTKPNAATTPCDADGTFDWQMHGSIVLRGKPGTSVKTQVWMGNGGGACYGGTGDPIVCDNPSTHWMMEGRNTVMQGMKHDVSVPFEFLAYQAPANWAYVGDADYFGMWIFANPDQPTSCVETSYSDLLYVDGANTTTTY